MSYIPPRASEFRNVLKVERHSATADGMGGYTDAWETLFAGVAACIREERGGEEVRSNRLSGISNYDIVLRSCPDVLEIGTGDRFLDLDGNAYNIKWVGDLEGRNRFLHFLCQRGGLTDES